MSVEEGQWKKVSKEFGSDSTCHTRFQEWVSIVFENVWKRLLEIYDEKSIGWNWQSMDSVTVKAPLGENDPE